MSNIKYGLISEVDARCLEKTIDIILKDELKINITEVGIYGGDTGGGMYEYVESMGGVPFITGIDNRKDNEPLRFNYDKLIIGNSNEVYNQIEDNSQHLILIDANHSYPMVISDYYCYKEKIEKGGFLCFHDVSPQAQGKDWQRMGGENDKDMYISVRKALGDIGLLDVENANRLGWKCVFWEWDDNDDCGGMICFKKLY